MFNLNLKLRIKNNEMRDGGELDGGWWGVSAGSQVIATGC